jgi:RNA polymerase sigma-70 factor (ECF subfamily)
MTAMPESTLSLPILLQAARRAEPDAIAALYRLHAGRLLRGATLLLGSRVDAEDLVHDLFVGLPEALRRYEDRGTFGAWLARIATRMALMRLRSQRSKREVDLSLELPASSNASDRLGDRLLIEQALRRLPEQSQTVVVLRDLYGWSYADIAEFLGAREATFMTRLSRAMERLKAALEEIR